MTGNSYYSNEEYERKREIRRARVEAEKARQNRNKKLFLGGLILLALLLLIVFAIVMIVKLAGKNKKVNIEDSLSPASLVSTQIPEKEDPIDVTVGDIESGEELKPGDEPSVSDETGSQGLGNLTKRFDVSADEFRFVSDTDTKDMSSEEFTSEYGYVVCLDTGKVLASKSGFEKMFPASMTKIMTVLTARIYISDEHLDDVVKLSYNAKAYDLKYGCSSAGYEEGETLTVRDLFYGTILPSGAEAAYMLAEYTAGTHEDFVDLMNETVKDLGLQDTTHFANCVGVYDDNNYSNCNDIAVILAAAMQDEFLAEVLGTRRYTSSGSEFHTQGVELSNWFLRRIEDKDTGGYVCGAKTGFVNQSGCCGASMMKGDDGKTYICVSGKAWSSWRCIYDHVAAYNIYAIGNTGYHKG